MLEGKMNSPSVDGDNQNTETCHRSCVGFLSVDRGKHTEESKPVKRRTDSQYSVLRGKPKGIDEHGQVGDEGEQEENEEL